MPTIDYFNDFATVANSRILTGTISAVNSSDCTVTVNGLAIPGVPYFYHCQHDTIDHGSRVFRVGDNVLLLHDGQLAAPSAANLRVIGFPDKLERCRGLGLAGIAIAGTSWWDFIDAGYYSWLPMGVEKAFIWGEESNLKTSEQYGFSDWTDGVDQISWGWSAGRYARGLSGSSYIYQSGAVLASAPGSVVGAAIYNTTAGRFLVIGTNTQIYTKKLGGSYNWVLATGTSFNLVGSPLFWRPQIKEGIAVDIYGKRFSFTITALSETSCSYTVATLETNAATTGDGDPLIKSYTQLMFVDYKPNGDLVEAYGFAEWYVAPLVSTPGTSTTECAMTRGTGTTETPLHTSSKFSLYINGTEHILAKYEYSKIIESEGYWYSNYEIGFPISETDNRLYVLKQALIEEMDLRYDFIATYWMESTITSSKTVTGGLSYVCTEDWPEISSYSSTTNTIQNATRQCGKTSTLYTPGTAEDMNYSRTYGMSQIINYSIFFPETVSNPSTTTGSQTWTCNDTYGERFDRISRESMKANPFIGPWSGSFGPDFTSYAWLGADDKHYLLNPYIRPWLYGVEYAHGPTNADILFSWVFNKGIDPYVYWSRGNPFTAAGVTGTYKAITDLQAI